MLIGLIGKLLSTDGTQIVWPIGKLWQFKVGFKLNKVCTVVLNAVASLLV